MWSLVTRTLELNKALQFSRVWERQKNLCRFTPQHGILWNKYTNLWKISVAVYWLDLCCQKQEMWNFRALKCREKGLRLHTNTRECHGPIHVNHNGKHKFKFKTLHSIFIPYLHISFTTPVIFVYTCSLSLCNFFSLKVNFTSLSCTTSYRSALLNIVLLFLTQFPTVHPNNSHKCVNSCNVYRKQCLQLWISPME